MLSGSAPATTTCFPVGPAAMRRPQLVERLGQRVLLAREPRHEATARGRARAPPSGAAPTRPRAKEP